MHGRGDILRIDLTKQEISREPIPAEVARKYLGGQGINAWLLWEHFLKVNPNIDPLSPDNVMIVGLGPLGGAFAGGAKTKWAFKSPAYNLFGESVSGGFFGPHLRYSGYDHLVLTGKADHPVYIWINDDNVEIRDAWHLWGKDCYEADDLLKKEMKDHHLGIALISQAGENLVTYASITNSLHRSAGRTGGGCVLGSKNVKALVAKGTKGISISDPKSYLLAMNSLLGRVYLRPEAIDETRKAGTMFASRFYDKIGGNAVKNNQERIMSPATRDGIYYEWYRDNMAVRLYACSHGCSASCASFWLIKGTENTTAANFTGEVGSKPEYIAVASFGAMCNVHDGCALAHLDNMCKKYAMDLMEIGACCGLLMELWQKGLIDQKDTEEWLSEPVTLEWGNHEVIAKIIESVAFQNNKMGKILQGGVYKAAQYIEAMKGVPALKYALYGKGGAAFNEEARSFPDWCMGMAVSSRGADHNTTGPVGWMGKAQRKELSKYYFGHEEAANRTGTKYKGAVAAIGENHQSIINSLGVCEILAGSGPVQFPLDIWASALTAATGDKYTADDLIGAGQRVVNLQKAFNSRLGMRRVDDKICDRWMSEPAPAGAGEGMKAEDYFQQTLDEYYEFHGWDKSTSLQRREKLNQLEMHPIAEILARESALVE